MIIKYKRKGQHHFISSTRSIIINNNNIITIMKVKLKLTSSSFFLFFSRAMLLTENVCIMYLISQFPNFLFMCACLFSCQVYTKIRDTRLPSSFGSRSDHPTCPGCSDGPTYLPLPSLRTGKKSLVSSFVKIKWEGGEIDVVIFRVLLYSFFNHDYIIIIKTNYVEIILCAGLASSLATKASQQLLNPLS